VNRTSIWARLAALAVILVALPACVNVSAGIAPSSRPLGSDESFTVLGNALGQAYGFVVFGFPISEASPTREAKTRALTDWNADALMDVTVDTVIYPIPFFTIIVTEVRGKAVRVNR